jgi:hypothetical protein
VDSDEEAAARADDLERFYAGLYLHGPPPADMGDGWPTPLAVSQEITSWGYNDVTYRVTTPDAGWLYLDRVFDPCWRATVDGQRVPLFRANVLGTGLPIGRGEHLVQLRFRPYARRFFWQACWNLEGALVAFSTIALVHGILARLRAKGSFVARAGILRFRKAA